MVRKMRGLVSKNKRRFIEGEFDLDLSYITDTIIAMGFPSEGSSALIRNSMPEVQRFLDTRHPKQYKVYNLCSEREYNTKENFEGSCFFLLFFLRFLCHFFSFFSCVVLLRSWSPLLCLWLL